MKLSIPIPRGIESFFGTRDENLRLLENSLRVRIILRNDCLEVDGDEASCHRVARIIDDYSQLIKQGHIFSNSDLNGLLRVVVADPEVQLRTLAESGKQRSFGKKTLAPKTVTQRRYIEAIERHDLVFGIGPAGTGKTYLAVAMAVSALLAKKVNRIILSRPALEAGERLGFLPGTLKEKIDPYLRPLYDALHDMIEADRVEKLLERQTIEVAPIAFMRGRTLNDAFIIVDEAQNTTREQMKMILTRMGFNSKMVVTGDTTQIDLPNHIRSGLVEAQDALMNVEGITFIQFSDGDVVRHSLVQRIIQAYDKYNEKTGIGRQMTLRLINQDPAAPAESSADPGSGDSGPGDPRVADSGVDELG